MLALLSADPVHSVMLFVMLGGEYARHDGAGPVPD